MSREKVAGGGKNGAELSCRRKKHLSYSRVAYGKKIELVGWQKVAQKSPDTHSQRTK